jgi:hypothetical protein
MIAQAIVVTSIGSAAGARAAAAALASAGSDGDRAGLLVDLAAPRPPRPSLIATAAARVLEERLAAHLPRASLASRGRFCHLAFPGEEDGVERIVAALPLARESVAIIHLPPALMQPLLAEPRVGASATMLRADLAEDRALTALVSADLIERGLRVAVLKQPLDRLSARLALLGAPPTGATGLPERVASRLLNGTPRRVATG